MIDIHYIGIRIRPAWIFLFFTIAGMWIQAPYRGLWTALVRNPPAKHRACGGVKCLCVCGEFFFFVVVFGVFVGVMIGVAEATGLGFVLCSQPSCFVSQQRCFFLFHKFSNFTPPSPQDYTVVRSKSMGAIRMHIAIKKELFPLVSNVQVWVKCQPFLAILQYLVEATYHKASSSFTFHIRHIHLP